MADAEGRTVRAAGGVLWRRADGEVQVALVHRPKYDDWSLPKGKLDPGEPAVAGAVREVYEETGFVAVPGTTLGKSRYRVLHRGRDVPKTVRWWAMRCGAGAFVPGEEVDALRWLPVPAALAVAGSGDTGPLQAFAARAPETVTVLLTDAAAPSRAAASAYAVRRVVGAAGAEDAAHRLAGALGVPVEPCAPDPVDPVRAVASGPPAVLCVPDAGAVLQQVTDGLPAAGPHPLWALTFCAQRLVDVVDAGRLEDEQQG